LVTTRNIANQRECKSFNILISQASYFFGNPQVVSFWWTMLWKYETNSQIVEQCFLFVATLIKTDHFLSNKNSTLRQYFITYETSHMSDVTTKRKRTLWGWRPAQQGTDVCSSHPTHYTGQTLFCPCRRSGTSPQRRWLVYMG